MGSFDSHGSPNPGPLGNLIQYDLLTHYKEYAAYADLTYSITPDLDVTGGLRVEAIDQDYEQLYFGPDAAALNNLYVALGYLPTPADTGVSHAKDTVQTYLANVRYHIAADDMIYFRFATGFRPGGPNIDVPGLPSSFKPDTTSDYEIGWKTNFWNDCGYLDLDVYQIDWNDIQVITFSHGVNGETNGGSATSRGVEASIDLEPVDGLSLAGTIAYSDAHLNQTIPGGIGDAGDTTPMNPKWSGSVSGEYTWPIASGWSALVNVSAHYVDRRWYGFQHNVIYGNYVLPSSTVVDLRTGVQHDNWELDFFVRNVGDTRAQLAASTLAGTDVTVERPRTLGLSLNMQF